MGACHDSGDDDIYRFVVEVPIPGEEVLIETMMVRNRRFGVWNGSSHPGRVTPRARRRLRLPKSDSWRMKRRSGHGRLAAWGGCPTGAWISNALIRRDKSSPAG